MNVGGVRIKSIIKDRKRFAPVCLGRRHGERYAMVRCFTCVKRRFAMSKTIVRPTLSLGNHIYLYRLLRDAIGCGKQTFMTQVEEALAAGDMTAYDLGFESTRELLE